MAYTGEGEVIISMEDFWSFAHDFAPGGELLMGVPRVTSDGMDMVITYAVGTESDPRTWVGEKPKAAKEWDNLKKHGNPNTPPKTYVEALLRAHIEYFGGTYHPETAGEEYTDDEGKTLLSERDIMIYNILHDKMEDKYGMDKICSVTLELMKDE